MTTRAAAAIGWAKLASFALGVLVLASYGAAEALARLGYALGPCAAPHGVPWGQVIAGVALIVPVTVGPGAAGSLIRSLGGRVGREPSTPARPGEEDRS